MPITLLHRGHKDEDYLKTKFKGVSFCEDLKLAVSYGLGQNDSSNTAVADGYVTSVEYHGNIVSVPVNGLGSVDKYIDSYRQHDAVRFKDGVIVVINFAHLKNHQRVPAASIKV